MIQYQLKEGNMPYIKQEDRKRLEFFKSSLLVQAPPKDPDSLKFTIMRICKLYSGEIEYKSKNSSQPQFIPDNYDRNNYIDSAGKLNYILTQAYRGYLKHVGESYNTYNEIAGILEEIILELLENVKNSKKRRDIYGAIRLSLIELYRRKISFYEDEKCKLHGDVFDLSIL